MPEETLMDEDVVLQRTLVTRVRVTVMALGMEVRMTDIEAAKEIWSAALITVRSLVCIITRRTIAVRGQ